MSRTAHASHANARVGGGEPQGAEPQPRAEGLLPLAVVGCDFRIASASWRQRALLDAAARQHLLGQLQRSARARGLVVLETCNRVAWWLDAPDPRWAGDLARAAMMATWSDLRAGDAPLPQPSLYVGEDAVRHLARVVVGLESFVVGEREIAGQLNRALDAARALGHSSPDLNALQTTLGRVVRAVERGTAFRAHGRGVHAVAVQALQTALGERPAQVVVVGLGEIGRKALGLCQRRSGWTVRAVNRTLSASQRGRVAPLEDLPALLAEADGMVVATGARQPLLTAAMLDAVCAARRARDPDAAPLQVIDLGAPAQVEAPSAGAEWRRQGLDELLVGTEAAPDRDELARVLALCEDAVAEHRAVVQRRSVGPLLREIWEGYDEVTARAVPQLLAAHAAGLSDASRAALEAGLREALRLQARRSMAAALAGPASDAVGQEREEGSGAANGGAHPAAAAMASMTDESAPDDAAPDGDASP